MAEELKDRLGGATHTCLALKLLQRSLNFKNSMTLGKKPIQKKLNSLVTETNLIFTVD